MAGAVALHKYAPTRHRPVGAASHHNIMTPIPADRVKYTGPGNPKEYSPIMYKRKIAAMALATAALLTLSALGLVDRKSLSYTQVARIRVIK